MKTILGMAILLAAFGASAADIQPVPGSRVGLTPPAGFSKADRFPGFVQQETGAAIMVTEMPGPYSQVASGFTAEGLASRGMTLLKKEEAKIAGRAGLLLHASQKAHGLQHLKWIAVFGDERTTTLVTASFPEEHAQHLSEPLRTAVAGAQIISPATGNQAASGVSFDLKPAGSLKIAKRMGNTLLVTRDGRFPAGSPTDPMLVAGASASQGMVIENKKDFSIARALAVTTLQNIRITDTKNVTLAGLAGFEIIAQGADKETGQGMVLCQTTLFGPTDYFIMQGLVRSAEKETYLPLFRQTMQSFTALRP